MAEPNDIERALALAIDRGLAFVVAFDEPSEEPASLRFIAARAKFLAEQLATYRAEILAEQAEKDPWRLVAFWRSKYNALLGEIKPREPEEIERDLRGVAEVVSQLSGPISLAAVRSGLQQLCSEYLAALSVEEGGNDG